MNEELIRVLSVTVEDACRSVANAFGHGIWSHHIAPMMRIAHELAEISHADREIVTIAVLLHDYAGIRDRHNRDDHHIRGAQEAEAILLRHHYPSERIELVKKCILNHRGSVNNPKATIEETCVADADAVAHMEAVASLFFVAYREMQMAVDEGAEWVRAKIERDWRKMSTHTQNRYRTRYDQIVALLR